MPLFSLDPSRWLFLGGIESWNSGPIETFCYKAPILCPVLQGLHWHRCLIVLTHSCTWEWSEFPGDLHQGICAYAATSLQNFQKNLQVHGEYLQGWVRRCPPFSLVLTKTVTSLFPSSILRWIIRNFLEQPTNLALHSRPCQQTVSL